MFFHYTQTHFFRRQLLEPQNTPFSNKSSANAAKRLWTYLVHQEIVQDIFIRAVFGKRRSLSFGEESLPQPEPPQQEPVRIIHKEQDSIAAFTLNQVSPFLIVNAVGCGWMKYLFNSEWEWIQKLYNFILWFKVIPFALLVF